MDILKDMEDIGFVDARVCAFASRDFAYLERNILFIAQKPGASKLASRFFNKLFPSKSSKSS
jgi:hypothetical protein